MTIKTFKELEEKLREKCPSVAIFDLGTRYSVVVPSKAWEGKLDEEILSESKALSCCFIVDLDENKNKCWKLIYINNVDYKEFID